MGLSPATPWGLLVLQLRCRVDRARTAPDRGASTIEWVIITGILVLVAAAVGAVIYNLVKGQADAITIPDAPGGGAGGGAGGT